MPQLRADFIHSCDCKPLCEKFLTLPWWDPFTNTLFLFCGRRRERLKGLYWEGDVFLLVYKRLEQGVYQWTRSTAEAQEITSQQYRWLMEGLQIEQPKAYHPMAELSMA